MNCEGSGLATEDDDRAEDGTISTIHLLMHQVTLRISERAFDSDHKIAQANIDRFWFEKQPIGRLVYLGVPSLDRVQRRLSAQSLQNEEQGVNSHDVTDIYSPANRHHHIP